MSFPIAFINGALSGLGRQAAMAFARIVVSGRREAFSTGQILDVNNGVQTAA